MSAFPSAGALRYWIAQIDDEDMAGAIMLELVERTAEAREWAEDRAYDFLVRMLRVVVQGDPREEDLIEWLDLNGGLYG